MKKISTSLLSCNIYFIALVGFAINLTSCGKKTGDANIPKDAQFVATFDLKNIKAKGGDIKKLILETPMSGISAKEKKTIEDAIDSFDDQQPAYFYTNSDKKNGYYAVSFAVKDTKKLKTSIESAPNAPKIKSDAGMEIGVKDGAAIGWTPKNGLIVGMVNGAEVKDQVVLDLFKKIFNTSATDALKEPSYLANSGAGYDISMWGDAKELQKSNKEMTTGVPFTDELAKNVLFFTVGCRFENGEIKFESNVEFDKMKSKKYEAVLNKGIKEKLAKTLPTTKPSALMSISLNVDAIFEMLKKEKSGLEGIESQARELDMKPKDIFDVFSGDMAFAIDNIDIEAIVANIANVFGGGEDDDNDDKAPKKIKTEAVFAIGLNNKDTFKKLIKKSIKDGNMEDKGGGVYTPPNAEKMPISVFLVEKGDAFYITTSERMKNDILKEKSGMDSDHIAIAKSGAFVMHLNLKNIFDQMPESFKKEKIIKDKIIPQFKDISSSSTAISNGKMSSKLNIRFNDKSKNGLVVLMDILKDAARQGRREEVSMR